MRFNFAEAVKKIIKRWVTENVETTLPGKIIDITGYSETQQIATVQPLINIIWEDNQVVEMPYLYNVPVAMLGTKESLISVPLKVGDTVRLDFCKRNIDTLKEQAVAATFTPEDRRYFDTNDAIAYPSVLNSPANLKPSSDHVEIKHKDILVSYQNDGTILETNGVATTQKDPDGNITINNDSGTLNISPDGILSYSSGPVSFVLNPNSDSLTVTASNTSFSGNVSIGGNTTMDGTLGVTGATTTSTISATSITASGSISVNGSLTQGGKDVGGSHTHGGVETGDGTTGGVV